MTTFLDLDEPTDAQFRLCLVPFDATTSFRPGTADGPEAIMRASHQVDLWHASGPFHHRGFHITWPPSWMDELNRHTRRCVVADQPDFAEADAAGAKVRAYTREWTQACLAAGQTPIVVGGDHSVPQGAIEAAAAKYPGLGVLHVDAHADLRVSYQGFRYSHASIFSNVLADANIGKLVQVGIRDRCQQEVDVATSDDRVHVLSDQRLANAVGRGDGVRGLMEEAIAHLPDKVWISWDIDGLEPSLCPNTGTPVPGGLSWREAMTLIDVVTVSGRTVIGFDVCEVAGAEWDATVGARLIFQLAAAASR